MRLTEAEYARLLARGTVRPLGPSRGTAETVPEKCFMAWLIREARLSGLLVYHTHDSRRSAPGFPDLALVDPRPGPGLCYLWEVKSAQGKLSMEQQMWLRALDGKHVSARLVRPSDMPDLARLLGRT